MDLFTLLTKVIFTNFIHYCSDIRYIISTFTVMRLSLKRITSVCTVCTCSVNKMMFVSIYTWYLVSTTIYTLMFSTASGRKQVETPLGTEFIQDDFFNCYFVSLVINHIR